MAGAKPKITWSVNDKSTPQDIEYMIQDYLARIDVEALVVRLAYEGYTLKRPSDGQEYTILDSETPDQWAKALATYIRDAREIAPISNVAETALLA